MPRHGRFSNGDIKRLSKSSTKTSDMVRIQRQQQMQPLLDRLEFARGQWSSFRGKRIHEKFLLDKANGASGAYHDARATEAEKQENYWLKECERVKAELRKLGWKE